MRLFGFQSQPDQFTIFLFALLVLVFSDSTHIMPLYSLFSVGSSDCFIHVRCYFSSSDDESMEDNTSLEILNAAKETLLQGLSEENQGLQ